MRRSIPRAHDQQTRKMSDAQGGVRDGSRHIVRVPPGNADRDGR